jgi:benzoyl-CoA reductase/2-hydroxyglutaryl-CoA dehydratase subunit BcrC/BadD/HgdB
MINDVPVISFEYPFSRDRDLLRLQIEKLAEALGTTLEAAQAWVERLRPIRGKLAEVDRLTWSEDVVSGAENHRLLVGASDFEGDPELFGQKVDALLRDARTRSRRAGGVRLGYIGVPPIWGGLYEFLESQGAHVVFNETQRQFSMCWAHGDIVNQYASYTYPYGVFARLEDIAAAISERAIEGVVHYTQSFCFRQIEDMIFREKLSVPILTIDGDQPAPLDGRTKIRITAFIEMVRRNQGLLEKDWQA